MKYLFTPIGGTDPISNNTCHDGSMLHIARVYRPDIIIMYMSKEIIEHHEADNRYIYCLDKLAEYIDASFEYRLIMRPELAEVQKFNEFYDDFDQILRDIYSEMNEGDELLINVSSGTPAMKSALMVIKTLQDLPGRLIQVITPNKSMSEHTHKGYDVKLCWECNEDNSDNFENRCSEIECPSLLKIKYKEIIKQHLLSYDYQAAKSVMQMLSDEDKKNFSDYINLAAARLMLNDYEMDNISKTLKKAILPYTDDEVRKDFEYALALEIKLRKCEYADFVRAISPIIFDLFVLILKNQCNIYVYDFCSKNDRGVYKWDRVKLSNSEDGLEIRDALYSRWVNFNYDVIYAIHIKELIAQFSRNTKLIELCEDLRFVEENVRNIAAHEIISIDDKFIKRRTNFTSDEIMSKIKKAFKYAGMDIKSDEWNSYDEMNRSIIRAIDGQD